MLASLRRSLKKRKRSRKPKIHKKSKAPKVKRGKSKGRKRTKKLNPYMVAVKKARKSGADSFTYGGNTYKKKVTKTGMTVYKK